ncbi:MAG TPA: helix-turn-helix transcriptional regulator [Bacillus sp. (in: firmicutes)]|nr:helix-turn-helix transcriptional regulator [Bacillus sp. (in: firmicutes)]
MIVFKIDELVSQGGKSRRKTANEMGIRQHTFNDLCNGKVVTVRVQHLDMICKYFNCSLEEIIGYQEDKNERKENNGDV